MAFLFNLLWLVLVRSLQVKASNFPNSTLSHTAESLMHLREHLARSHLLHLFTSVPLRPRSQQGPLRWRACGSHFNFAQSIFVRGARNIICPSFVCDVYLIIFSLWVRAPLLLTARRQRHIKTGSVFLFSAQTRLRQYTFGVGGGCCSHHSTLIMKKNAPEYLAWDITALPPCHPPTHPPPRGPPPSLKRRGPETWPAALNAFLAARAAQCFMCSTDLACAGSLLYGGWREQRRALSASLSTAHFDFLEMPDELEAQSL